MRIDFIYGVVFKKRRKKKKNESRVLAIRVVRLLKAHRIKILADEFFFVVEEEDKNTKVYLCIISQ